MNVWLVRVWLDPSVPSPGMRLYVEGPRRAEARLRFLAPGATIPAAQPPPVDEHLAVGPGESPWGSIADVLVAEATPPFAGSLVTGVVRPGGGAVVRIATGWRALFVPLRAGCGLPLPCACLVHAWLVAGRPIAELDRAAIVDERGEGFRIVAVTPEADRRDAA